MMQSMTHARRVPSYVNSHNYTFSDVADSLQAGLVTVRTEHNSDSQRIRRLPDRYSMKVAVNDGAFSNRGVSNMPSQIADLIDIGVAVHTADRLTVRRPNTRANIHVTLPLRHQELWNNRSIKQDLENTLYWFTRDNWHFESTLRGARPRQAELQNIIPFDTEPREVALWSGGLDSMAGLVNRMGLSSASGLMPSRKSLPHQYTLFGTGSSSYMMHVQGTTARAVTELAPNDIKLSQVPISFEHTREAEIFHIQKNSAQRSRGFVFMIMGAACAFLEGQSRLHIYENGIGALNLPFRASEQARDHAVSVHPWSLYMVSNLLSKVLGLDFVIENPFVLWTKAEMCEILADLSLTHLIELTVSCDHRRRERLTQCGCCSSCLLRRQALLAAGIPDRTRYGALSCHAYGSTHAPFRDLHYWAMKHQIDQIVGILQGPEPWRNLVARFADLERVPDEAGTHDLHYPRALSNPAQCISSEEIIGLLQRYTREWTEDVSDHLQLGLQNA